MEYIERQMKPDLASKSWELMLGTRAASPPGSLRFAATASTAFVRVDKTLPVLAGGPSPVEAEVTARRKIWDLGSSLHCSIIGTCLTAGELRALVRKFHSGATENPTDHDLHTIAVSAINHRDLLAKQIQKALDRRHAAAIHHFAPAKNVEELRVLWTEARHAGEIPGAYWATMTHPKTSDGLVRQIFGDVHMLSHLVGAANRADIRRLHQLEEEKAALEERLERQQTQLRDGIVSRDAKIRELNAALSVQIERHSAVATSSALGSVSEIVTLHALIADLRKLLDREVLRRERAEKRAEDLTAANTRHERSRLALEEEVLALRAEIEAVEEQLASTQIGEEPAESLDLAGAVILYVGGRPHQVARLRSVVEQAAGELVHHDGGIEERADLLPGLVSRAQVAFFPVDCISHPAALTLKRLCQQAGKPYVPLRSASLASMLRALREFGERSVTSPRSAAE